VYHLLKIFPSAVQSDCKLELPKSLKFEIDKLANVLVATEALFAYFVTVLLKV